MCKDSADESKKTSLSILHLIYLQSYKNIMYVICKKRTYTHHFLLFGNILSADS